MAVAYVGTVSTSQTGTGSSGTLTVGTAATAGTLVVVAVKTGGGGTLSTISDSQSNAWTIVDASSVSGARAHLAYSLLTAGLTTSDTISMTFGASAASAFQAFAFSGATSIAPDVTASSNATTNVTTLSAATAAVAGAGELLLAVLALPASSGNVSVSGSTLRSVPTGAAVNFAATPSAGSGAQTVQFTWTSANTADMIVAALQVASSSIASGTGALSLSGSATAAAPATATASLSLGASSTAVAADTAAATLNLTATATAAAPTTATGALGLTAAATVAAAAATASAALNLTASATAAASTIATGGITLAGSSSTQAPVTISGALTLTAAAAMQATAQATALLTLAGVANPGTTVPSLRGFSGGSVGPATSSHAAVTVAGSSTGSRQLVGSSSGGVA